MMSGQQCTLRTQMFTKHLIPGLTSQILQTLARRTINLNALSCKWYAYFFTNLSTKIQPLISFWVQAMMYMHCLQ